MDRKEAVVSFNPLVATPDDPEMVRLRTDASTLSTSNTRSSMRPSIAFKSSSEILSCALNTCCSRRTRSSAEKK